MQPNQRVRRWLACAGTAAAMAGAFTAQAVTDKTFDFNSDPSGVLNTYGNAQWRPDGGNPAAGGYLSITDAIDSQGGIIVFDDFDNGLVVKGFNFKVDLRVGNSSDADGRPADGFSVNFARQTDPIIVKADGGETPDGYADSAGAHEFGTKTGIAVSFDTWSGNALPDTTDVEGVIVRVDNKTVTKVPMPTRNGACDEPTSLQTGPWNIDLAGAPDELCWKQLEVNLDAAGLLTVTWKGTVLLDKYQTTFTPSRGRIVFMGRTGGNNQNNHIDNIVISTIAASTATVSGLTPLLNGFTVEIADAPGSVVNPATIVTTLDGATVTTVNTKTGGNTLVSYTLPAGQRFESGSQHPLSITFKDANNTYTESRTVSVPAYGLLAASTKVPAATTSQRGFKIRPHQVDAGQPNTIVWTEEQLAGLRGANRVNLANLGLTADAQGFIAWEQALDVKNPSGGAGYFTVDLGLDQLGLPGFNEDGSQKANEDNSALEIFTFVEFPTAGPLTMNVASDDGFRVQSVDVLGARLGEYNGGRGIDAGTTFFVWVEEPGIYPIRVLWENGGGGAGVEWMVVNADGTRSLIGNPDDPKSLKAYRAASTVRPYVASVIPVPDATEVVANQAIEVVIENAGAVDSASVELSLNGAVLTTTKTTAGTKLTVKAALPGLLASGSVNKVTLSYTPTGAVRITRDWSFTAAAYQTLPASIAGAVGAGNTPGFRVKTYQLGVAADQTDPAARMANDIEWSEGMLAGGGGANVADLTQFTDGGYYRETAVINYSQVLADGTVENAGNFNPNVAIPGVTAPDNAAGNTDNVVAEALSFLEFPTRGFYLMGVNSDDGFKVTSSHDAWSPVVVTAPASVAGPVAAVPSIRNTLLAGIFGPLPTTPIEADVVVAQGNNAAAPAEQGCGGALLNAEAVKGKVVLVSRGTCTFLEKANNAYKAGAVAVLVYQNRSDPPIVLGGDANTIPIPVLMITQAKGLALKDAAGAKVRISSDPRQILGVYNNGRGATDTLFGIWVETPGVYPIRLIWQEGGGGANVEWFTVVNGTRILVNDTASANGIRAFQKATIAAKPTVTIAASGANASVAYSSGSTLQSATTVAGPWTDVAGAANPYIVSPSQPAQFFRARR